MTQSIGQRVRDLRTRGRLGEALAEMNAVLQGERTDPRVVRECLPLCLALGDSDRAWALYSRLRSEPEENERLDPAALARLQLLLPERPVPELARVVAANAPAWVARYLTSGRDPRESVRPLDVRVDSLVGSLSYQFVVPCGWCDSRRGVESRLGLLIDREWICPACLGRTVLRFDAVRDFLVERYPELTAEGADRWYDEFIPLARRYAEVPADPAIPQICTYQSQHYAFFLAQLLTTRLLEEDRVSKTVFVAGLFWDRNATFFSALCRRFRVIASHYTPLGVGEQYPYTVTEELIGYDVVPSAREVAWEVSEACRFAERTLGNLTGRDEELVDEEFSIAFDTGLGALRSEEKLRRLARKVRIDLVVTSSDYDWRRRPIVLTARELGIPTFCIDHGFWGSKPWLETLKPPYRFHPTYLSDVVSLDNEIEVDATLRNQRTMKLEPSTPRFVALGTPQDNVFDPDVDRAAAARKLELDPQAFTVLLLGSSQEGRTPADVFKAEIEAVESYRRFFAGWGRSPLRDRVQVVVKLHPAYRRPDLFVEAERLLQRFAAEAHCPRPRLLLENLPEALATADVLVCPKFTSVFWDGFLAGMPSIVFPVPRYREWLVEPDALSRGNLLFQRGVLRAAYDSSEIWQQIASLYDEAARAEVANAATQLWQEYSIELCSPARKSERICEYLASL